jgi:hypothetical protein
MAQMFANKYGGGSTKKLKKTFKKKNMEMICADIQLSTN